MELKTTLLFVFVWLVVGLVSRAAKKGPESKSGGPQGPPPRKPAVRGNDAIQQEGGRLELVLQQVKRVMEEAEELNYPQRRIEVLGRRPKQRVEERSLE